MHAFVVSQTSAEGSTSFSFPASKDATGMISFVPSCAEVKAEESKSADYGGSIPLQDGSG
jgi:hypothetical protein